MSKYIGIDTSNYTTSVCIYDDTDNSVLQARKLLPVQKGQLGLRQSDAVFHHTQQLPALVQQLFSENNIDVSDIKAVGASFTPRKVDGSYMPCFTVGSGVATILSSVLNVPLYNLSHQQGHIAAALYSVDRLDLLTKPFIAFHVSGGTTDAMLLNSSSTDELSESTILSSQLVATTLDLNAGQLVDRVGLMLSCDFPCGKQLESLALECSDDIKLRPTLKGADCCLSGAENICQRLLSDGYSKPYIARFCLKYIEQTILSMSKQLIATYGQLPVVFAGGVMSNSIIRDSISSQLDCIFSKPEFSTDNACGIAVLTSILYNR